ncbi:MAG TPA: glycosyltransferase [Chitinophagales bacterium]|nr:glycosyltransferase [Chitinophagales bacterium]
MEKFLSGKKIVVAPLNWGLGHATRSIPVVERLIHYGADVHLAGDGDSLKFISEEFPRLKTHSLPSYNIEYPSGWGGAWKTVMKAPSIIRAIKKEQKAIQKIIIENNIDAIISDNRYGVYSDKIPSIFLGHQIRVLPPKLLRWGSGIILFWHKTYLKNFREIWVPDYEKEHNLSGILSHDLNLKTPIKYIGPLSRFSSYHFSNKEKGNKIVAVLSGPEPQRSYFEEIIAEQLKEINLPSILIRGVVENAPNQQIGHLTIINYLHTEDLLKEISNAKIVICRPGYSTIMDLSLFGKKMILIPTPGQTEQEYLSENLSQQGKAIVQKQKAINIKEAILQLESVEALSVSKWNYDLLDKEIRRFGQMMTNLN